MKIEGEAGILKDPSTGAIISNNINAYKLFRLRKNKEKAVDNNMRHLNERITRIEDQLSEILDRLK